MDPAGRSRTAPTVPSRSRAPPGTIPARSGETRRLRRGPGTGPAARPHATCRRPAAACPHVPCGERIRRADVVEIAGARLRRPHHVQGRPRADLGGFGSKSFRVVAQQHPGFRQRRWSLLEHDHRPPPFRDHRPRVALIPMILEAEVVGRHGRGRDFSALRPGERFDDGRQIVGGRQAVADEEDADRGGLIGRLRAGSDSRDRGEEPDRESQHRLYTSRSSGALRRRAGRARERHRRSRYLVRLTSRKPDYTNSSERHPRPDLDRPREVHLACRVDDAEVGAAGVGVRPAVDPDVEHVEDLDAELQVLVGRRCGCS